LLSCIKIFLINYLTFVDILPPEVANVAWWGGGEYEECGEWEINTNY
jgi:hypothetical protein